MGVYRLHVASFAVYNGLITYTMALRLRTGLAFAVLFVVAMGLHFVLIDRGLEQRYARRFAASGRRSSYAWSLRDWPSTPCSSRRSPSSRSEWCRSGCCSRPALSPSPWP